MTKDDGGPAFPSVIPEQPGIMAGAYIEGMTLRDYFAAKAMQQILPLLSDNGRYLDSMKHEIANQAYQMSDAMLAEKNK